MSKKGGRLLDKLGELRDTQVMIEWIKNPGVPKDDAAKILLERLTARESELSVQFKTRLPAISGAPGRKGKAANDWTAIVRK